MHEEDVGISPFAGVMNKHALKRKRKLRKKVRRGLDLPEGAVGFAEWQSQCVLVEDDPEWRPYYRWVANPDDSELRVTAKDLLLWLWVRGGFPREPGDRYRGRRLGLWLGGTGGDLEAAALDAYLHYVDESRPCTRKPASRHDAPKLPVGRSVRISQR